MSGPGTGGGHAVAVASGTAAQCPAGVPLPDDVTEPVQVRAVEVIALSVVPSVGR
jgi:hypothetical protein